MTTNALSTSARFDNEPILLNPDYLRASADAVVSLDDPAKAETLSSYQAMEAAYGVSFGSFDKPFAFADGIAFIPVTGVLLHRFNGAYSFATGYSAIRRLFNAAVEDTEVKAIVLDVNSGGGDAAGCFELAEEIRAARGTKPIRAVVDAHAYSAAYAIASAADQITLTPSGGVGSIGVVTAHFDWSQHMADSGVKVTMIYAGKHKVDGNPYEKLSPAAKVRMQARVEYLYEMFATTVATNRSLDVAVVKATEAATYSATDALDIGLVDAIASPRDVLASLAEELSGSQSQFGDYSMSTEKNKPEASAVPDAPAANANASAPAEAPQAAASTDASTQERARISGILTCEEAKGRESLANHFAFNTVMSAADAQAALAAAPQATNEASASAPVQSDAFAAAMATGNPEVGAEAGASADAAADSIQEVLKAFSAATGVTINAVKH
jgi:signal peptide peptidase SppA